MMRRTAGAQAGAALIVGLILLMVMTVLGITGMTRAILDMHMADNTRQGQYAFEAAQSAIDTEIVDPNPITYTGEEAPGSGWEAGTMTALHFEIDANGRSTQRGAHSEQLAGFYVMAPK